MKKICLALLICLTACNSVTTYDTEFKNPVFNQPLEPVSKTAGYTYLTQTSVDFRTPLDKNKIDTQGKCDLIENKQDRITLQCQVEGWGRTYNKYYTFVIKEVPWYAPECLRILEYSYDNPEDFPKNDTFTIKYCVTPKKDMTSKID